jgi:hypothetical protein
LTSFHALEGDLDFSLRRLLRFLDVVRNGFQLSLE